MDFETLAKERYSLRKFDARPVEPEKLELILPLPSSGFAGGGL